MRRSRGLDSLRKLAEFAADEASRTAAERLHVVKVEEQRLEQLDRYVSDYARLVTQTEGGSAMNLRARRQFVERLQVAAGQQRANLTQQEQQFKVALAQWRDERARALALTRYAERLAQEQREARERRDQARLDEVGRESVRRQPRR